MKSIDLVAQSMFNLYIDNEVAKLQHDKERLSNKILNFQNSENDHTKYEKLMNENQILKQRLAEYEKGANNQDE